MLNRLETERPFATFMGGWCFGPQKSMTLVSFYPNMGPGRGYAANIALEAVIRVRWASSEVFTDDRHPMQRGKFPRRWGSGKAADRVRCARPARSHSRP